MKNTLAKIGWNTALNAGLIRGFGFKRSPHIPLLGVGVRNRNFGNRVVTTRARRSNRRFRRKSGVEINHADGGFKKIMNTGRVDQIGINKYYTMAVRKIANEWKYIIRTSNIEYFTELDITNVMNSSNEFKQKLQGSSQYLVKNVLVSLNYSRIPEAGESFCKLLFNVKMDKIITEDPLIERSTMALDMSRNGTKNFNFTINRRNTDVLNTGWQDSHYLWSGNCELQVNQQGKITVNDPNNDKLEINLGVIKITITVLVRLQDSTNSMPTKKVKLEQLQEELFTLKAMVKKLEKEKEEILEEKEVDEDEEEIEKWKNLSNTTDKGEKDGTVDISPSQQ